ncbi:hypothetical protein PIB30_020941 [Stylosanthes scabra]|uniref:Reverse transcriptase domain-containing protein n=1 Tax=Stylosanthes scabra TaxID=79078 RepID=A0ABU6Q8M6_9FABA|nr:hypothetical protein [Stylosanthes scabra]
MADHRQEPPNTNPLPETSGTNVPPKTHNQPWNTRGRDTEDGHETSVTRSGENLNQTSNVENREPHTLGRRHFYRFGDDQHKMAQEMRHRMRGIERRFDRECRSRSHGRNSSSSSPLRQRSKERSRSRSRRHRTPTPPRRRNQTPEVLDDGWEQEIMGRTPFAPHILRVRFPKSFTKPTNMGYDGSTDPEDHLDAFEGRMNSVYAGDAMRCKAFPVSLAGQAM